MSWTRLAMDVGARQLWWQPHAARLQFGWLGRYRLALRLDFLGDGGHVGIHRLFQEARLRRVQLLAALALPPALLQRQLPA